MPNSADLWSYPETIGRLDMTGFEVEAQDGEIGKVDETSHEAGAGFIVVDTGPWIFGKKVLLPAGVVERVDREDEKVFVSRTKDEIEAAPEFDKDRYRDQTYHAELTGYYQPGEAEADPD